MSDRDLKGLLEAAPVPDAYEAERRGWRVVRAAFEAEKDELRARRPRPTRLIVAVAVALALGVGAVTAPGEAVTTWIRETIGVERVQDKRTQARPALTSLPGAGRLLVASSDGVWVVWPNGSRRRLGAYEDATWSPHGLFVAATRGRQLVALEPDGDVRWIISRARALASPRWSPSGYRIAYGSGPALRVVHGNGSFDRLLAPAAAPGAWAWRPGEEEHVLAYATAQGVVRVVATDSGKLLWTATAEGVPRELEWTSDGKRLLVVSRESVRVVGPGGQVVAVQADRRKRAGRPVAADLAPNGRAVALVQQLPTGRSEVVLVPLPGGEPRGRRLFVGAGTLGEVEWSPDGRWLLVTWPSADQWLFLRVPGVRKIVAVSNIAREFEPAGRARAPVPHVLEWCCAP